MAETNDEQERIVTLQENEREQRRLENQLQDQDIDDSDEESKDKSKELQVIEEESNESMSEQVSVKIVEEKKDERVLAKHRPLIMTELVNIRPIHFSDLPHKTGSDPREHLEKRAIDNMRFKGMNRLPQKLTW